MKADLSRWTFDERAYRTRVVLQQGRILLDADFNEQTEILLYYLRRLAVDLVGPHWGRENHFKIEERKSNDQSMPYDFLIKEGHYYVDGILCVNETDAPYTGQPYYPLPTPECMDHLGEGKYLVYLDVWERFVTYIQDPLIREVALRGPDTCGRTKVVWQVRLVKYEPQNNETPEEFLDRVRPPLSNARLRARSKQDHGTEDPCTVSPESRYRGVENQLYRVEIHSGSDSGRPTFKWSRDNGSVVFAIEALESMMGDTEAIMTVTLEHLGRDTRFGLQTGDWVEIIDDAYALQIRAHPLFRVQEVRPAERQAVLIGAPHSGVGQDSDKYPLLRRWDQKAREGEELREGAAEIREDEWLDLEDGVQIYFEANGTYRTSDYWQIPARTATGDVEWPDPPDDPLLPHGVQHHYAPLASISLAAEGDVGNVNDLRCIIQPLCERQSRSLPRGRTPPSTPPTRNGPRRPGEAPPGTPPTRDGPGRTPRTG